MSRKETDSEVELGRYGEVLVIRRVIDRIIRDEWTAQVSFSEIVLKTTPQIAACHLAATNWKEAVPVMRPYHGYV